jgi:quercetin dioxygenase-like cupin family protein
MDSPYRFFADLAREIPAVAPDSIVSRTLYSDGPVKVILFGFAAGQELSEHTAAVPAILHFLAGRAKLTAGGDELEAGPGAWLHLPARQPHSVRAETPLQMLLLLLPGQ